MPAAAFEERYFAPMPPATNAQEAATRVYNRGGILVRSDPYISAADRNGGSFQKTKWHSEPEVQATLPPARLARSKAREDAKPTTAFEKFKKKVLERGGAGGIHTLARSFRTFDDDHNQTLNAEELTNGLHDYGIRMYPDEIQELIAAMDKDGSGRINFDEFLLAVRGDINKRRMKLIHMAFKVMDKTGDGQITLDDIKGTFSIRHDPDVLSGKESEDYCLERFLSQFDSAERDGIVTETEFKEYYKNVSASIDDDDYFELMIRNAWHIPGGEGWCANTANTRLLVVFTNGDQKVVELLDDLGLDLEDNAAVMKQLKKQGLTGIQKFSLSGNC